MCVCCMHVYMCTPVYVGVLTYACACEGQKLPFCVLSFPLIFWDTDSHWAWSSALQLEWLAREQQLSSEGLGSKLRCPHSWGECSGPCAIPITLVSTLKRIAVLFGLLGHLLDLPKSHCHIYKQSQCQLHNATAAMNRNNAVRVARDQRKCSISCLRWKDWKLTADQVDVSVGRRWKEIRKLQILWFPV